jgi:ATP-dependent Clp protease, protease subunit
LSGLKYISKEYFMPIAKFSNAVLDALHYFNVHIPSRTIYLLSEVDQKMRDNLLKAVRLVDAPGETITVILDSLGGDLYSGLTIYDALRSCAGKVKIIGYGTIMSMATTILQAADPIKQGGGRFLAPNSTVMLHRGSCNVDLDHPDNVERLAKENTRVFNITNKIVADNMGITMKAYKEKYTFDRYFTANQAIALGIADALWVG